MREAILSSSWLLAPIVLCSIVAFGLAVERALHFWRAFRRDHDLVERVGPLLASGDLAEARRECASVSCPLGEVLLVVLDAWDGPDDVRDSMASVAIEEQLLAAERGLRGLATIGRIAPLLGLFGTVAGLIGAFRAFGIDAARPDPALLAAGIWQALITTVAGLAVAIPAIIAYEWFATRVDRLAFLLRAAAVRLVAAGSVGRQAP